MDKSVYLIDYENVSYKGLYGISSVKPKDEIVIFYSNDISIIKDIISIYEKSDVIIKYYKLDKTGKNALDFMISAYAGYAVLQENVSKIAIISNDKEYSSIMTVIKSINSNVKMLFDCCIHNIIYPDNKKDIATIITASKSVEKSVSTSCEPVTVQLKPTTISKKQPITKERIQKYLKNNIPEKYVGTIIGIMVKSLSNGASESQFSSLINNAFGSKQCNNVYKNIVKKYFIQLKNEL